MIKKFIAFFILCLLNISVETVTELDGSKSWNSMRFVNTANAEDIEHITVTGTQYHHTMYSTLGVYYVYGSSYDSLYAQAKWISEYDKLTQYSHCMSAAASSKDECEEQARNDINTVAGLCAVGANLAGYVWGLYFTPVSGYYVGAALTSACIIAQNDALQNVGDFCDSAIEAFQAECRFKYYGA